MVKLDWHNTDTEECFNKHYERFPKLFQVYKDTPIEYTFNSDGFRMEFELIPDKSRKVDIYLGCSHTYGAGHYWENTWPYRVAQYTGNEIVNLGVGGQGSEGAFHGLLKYISYYNVQNVFYFQDINARYDYFDANQNTHPFSPHFPPNKHQQPCSNWYLSKVLVHDWYIYYNYFKNVMAMKGLCDVENIPFWNISQFPHDPTGYYQAMTTGYFEIKDLDEEWYENNADKVLIARDGTHSPVIIQEIVANKFIRAMKADKNGYIQQVPYREKIFQKISP